MNRVCNKNVFTNLKHISVSSLGNQGKLLVEIQHAMLFLRFLLVLSRNLQHLYDIRLIAFGTC